MNKTKEKELRDNYYTYLMKKYNHNDIETIEEIITEEENEKREELELAAMDHTKF